MYSLKELYDNFDLEEIKKFYAEQDKIKEQEEEKKRAVALKGARDRAVKALYFYFKVLVPNDKITIEEIEKDFIQLEKQHIDKDKDKKSSFRGYSATKKKDNDWDVRFEGDFTKEEKEDLVKEIKKLSKELWG